MGGKKAPQQRGIGNELSQDVQSRVFVCLLVLGEDTRLCLPAMGKGPAEWED